MQVFDRLQQRQLPEYINLIEGGLMGLKLLPLLEHGGHIVFVDTVSGFTQPDCLVILEHDAIIAHGSDRHYHHQSGLSYLLSVLPLVCEDQLPESIVLLGIEGPYSESLLDQAADTAILLAQYGRQYQPTKY